MTLLLKILAFPFKAIAFVILLFYEWGWEPLAKWIAKLLRFRWVRWAERKIRYAPPWAALLLFLTPTLILLPFKLGAFWLMAHGKKMLGIAVIVAAKLVGTAVVAWIFKLTQPTLMQFRWFAWVYPRVKAWKERWVAWMKATSLWRAASSIKTSLKIAFSPMVAALRAAISRVRARYFQ
jgi:hypothetical protein